MSDFGKCTFCGRTFYFGMTPPERWHFRDKDGNLYCSKNCAKFGMSREEFEAQAKAARDQRFGEMRKAEEIWRKAEEICRAKAVPAAAPAEAVREKKGKTSEELRRARRERLSADGICIECGKKAAEQGSKYCGECRQKLIDLTNAKRERRKEAGLCVQCGRIADTWPDGRTKRLCKRCAAQVKDRILRKAQDAVRAGGRDG